MHSGKLTNPDHKDNEVLEQPSTAAVVMYVCGVVCGVLFVLMKAISLREDCTALLSATDELV